MPQNPLCTCTYHNLGFLDCAISKALTQYTQGSTASKAPGPEGFALPLLSMGQDHLAPSCHLAVKLGSGPAGNAGSVTALKGNKKIWAVFEGQGAGVQGPAVLWCWCQQLCQ